MDLTQFVDAYRGPLVGLIVSWGAPWSDATEIAQDSFAEAWVRRDQCRGDSAFTRPLFLQGSIRSLTFSNADEVLRSPPGYER